MINLTSRVPPFFCSSSSVSTCWEVNKPSSTRASAMRSPNDLTLAMSLTESFADILHQFGRRRQVPEQPVGGGFGQFLRRLLVERICGGHQNSLAHPVERQQAPATTGGHRESPRQFHVHLIFIQRQISQTRLVGQQFERLLDRQNSFF